MVTIFTSMCDVKSLNITKFGRGLLINEVIYFFLIFMTRKANAISNPWKRISSKTLWKLDRS